MKQKNTFGKKRSRKGMKYAVIAAVLAAGAYAVFTVPAVVETFVPKVRTIFPSVTDYTPSVSCSGTFEYADLNVISENLPLVIKNYTVNVGDRIDDGQLIGYVDKEATLTALAALYGASAADTQEIQAAVGALPEQIISDITGTVCELSECGALINAGDSIAKIGDKGDLCFIGAVSQRYISQVQPGQRVILSTQVCDDIFIGTVEEIGQQARKEYNGTAQDTVVDVTVTLDEPSQLLKSGYTADGEISTGLKKSLITLPYSAICQDEKGEYVYVFREGSAVRRDITTGIELENAAQVSGISRHEEIIASPQNLNADSLVIRDNETYD